AFLPLFAAGWLLGGAAVILGLIGMTSSLPVALRALTALCAAIVAPPLLGTSSLSPVPAMLASGAALFLVGIRLRRTGTGPAPLGPSPGAVAASAPLDRRTRGRF